MSKSFRKHNQCMCTYVQDSWLRGKLRQWSRRRRKMIKIQIDEEGIPILPVQAGSKWPDGGSPYKHSGLKYPDNFSIIRYRAGRAFLKSKNQNWKA